MCDLFGEGAASCPSTGDVEPYNPEPYVPDDPVDPVDPPSPHPWSTFAELEEIRANPHYSEENYSRTMYQVDRELEFIEKKLLQLFKAAYDNDLIDEADLA